MIQKFNEFINEAYGPWAKETQMLKKIYRILPHNKDNDAEILALNKSDLADGLAYGLNLMFCSVAKIYTFDDTWVISGIYFNEDWSFNCFGIMNDNVEADDTAEHECSLEEMCEKFGGENKLKEFISELYEYVMDNKGSLESEKIKPRAFAKKIMEICRERGNVETLIDDVVKGSLRVDNFPIIHDHINGSNYKLKRIDVVVDEKHRLGYHNIVFRCKKTSNGKIENIPLRFVVNSAGGIKEMIELLSSGRTMKMDNFKIAKKIWKALDSEIIGSPKIDNSVTDDFISNEDIAVMNFDNLPDGMDEIKCKCKIGHLGKKDLYLKHIFVCSGVEIKEDTLYSGLDNEEPRDVMISFGTYALSYSIEKDRWFWDLSGYGYGEPKPDDLNEVVSALMYTITNVLSSDSKYSDSSWYEYTVK